MALIGSIAINMSVRTANLVKGMKAAQKSVADFGNRAAASVGNFGSMVGATGRAIGGVVDQFYIKPFKKVASIVGDVGKEFGASMGWAARGATGPVNRIAGGMVAMAKSAGRFGLSVGRLGLGGASAGFRFLGQAVGATAKGLRSAVGALGSFQAMIVGGVIGGGLYKVARAASSLGEQTDRARNEFGEFAGEMIKQAYTMGDAFGLTRSEFIRSASDIGAQFKGLGYTAEDAANIGIHFSKLAVDASSRFQVPISVAMDKMTSAFAGEARAVKEWGIDLTEANLKVKGATMGMVGELTQAQKSQIRVALMEEKLSRVHGDLAATSHGAENAAKGLMGRLENLGETIGTALLPIVGTALVQMQVGVEALSGTWKSMTAGIVNDQVGVVGAVGETAGAMGLLQKSVGFVADAFQIMKVAFYGVQSGITANIGTIVTALSYLGSAIDMIVEKTTGMKPGIGDFLRTYSEDLDRLSASQRATAMTELAKPAASEGVNKAFAEAQARIQAARAEAMKPGVDVTKLAPKTAAAPAPTKVAETKFASAALAGSSEGTNAYLKSKYGAGAGGQKPEELTAKNTAELVTLMKRMVGTGKGELGQTQELAVMALAGNW